MTEYCESADVKKRATVNGWRYLTDRDHDGQTNTTESGEIEAAIQWAGDEIDVALYPRIQASDARGQQSRYLKNLCVDLSVHRLFSQGGDDVPTSIQEAFKAANEKLTRIKGGEAVPGLSMVHPRPSTLTSKVPRAYMPRPR